MIKRNVRIFVLLFVGLFLFSVTVVNANMITNETINSCAVVIDEPIAGNWYDPVSIRWHYEGDCSPFQYHLSYQEGSCNGNSLNTIEKNIDPAEFNNNIFDWDVSGMNDGPYCIFANMDPFFGGQVTGNSGIWYLDLTPPVADYNVYDGFSVECDSGEDCDYYINQESRIQLTCKDQGEYQSGGPYTKYYRYNVNGDAFSDWMTYKGPFSFPEDSEHMLEYYCTDEVGKASNIESAILIVDSVAPEIDFDVIGPSFGDCPPESESSDVCYVDGITEVEVNATDPEPHPVEGVNCSWDYAVYEGDNYEGGRGGESPLVPFMVDFTEESRHELSVKCWDALGNTNSKSARFYVDWTHPEIMKSFGMPYFADDSVEWIGVNTPVFINLIDPAPHPSGIDSAEYRTSIVDDEFCRNQELCYEEAEGNGSFSQAELYDVETPDYNGDVIICHNGDDSLRNMVVSEAEAENHISDHESDSYGQCGEDGETDDFGDIAYCHNDHGTGEFVNKVSGAGGANNHVGKTNEPMHLGDSYGPCTTKQFEFSVGEESCHLIEVNTQDNVEKSSSHRQCVFVDDTAPKTIKEVGKPSHDCDGIWEIITQECQENWDWIITMNTPISLSCEDQGQHPSGSEKLCWRMELDGDEATKPYCNQEELENGWCCEPTNELTMNFNEESEHLLEFYCVDNVGKESEIDSELFKVEGSSFDVEILEKWNLISIPFSLISNNVGEVFEDISEDIEIIWTYDETGWHAYSSEGPQDIEEIKPGYGYWVKANKDTTLTVGGNLFNVGPVTPPIRKLEKGWNLIGHYGLATKPSYCSLFSLIDTTIGYPRWSAVFGYDSETDDFESIGAGEITSPGKGYWIEMDVEDSYSPSSVCWGLDVF